MIKNIVKTAIRFSVKNRLVTILNLIGMAIGIAASLILIMHVKYEFSYDDYVPEKGRVFRIIKLDFGEDEDSWAATSPQLLEEATLYFPEIEKAVRFKTIRNALFTKENENGELISFEESGGFYADSTVFDVFGINLIKGSKLDFYSDINSLIISKSIADKFYGKIDPIGKEIAINGELFAVKGVMPDCPVNSHIHYNFLLPYKRFKYLARESSIYQSRDWGGVYTYVKIKENVHLKDLRKKFADFTEMYYAASYNTKEEILENCLIELQPITDIHLHSNLEKEIELNGNSTHVKLFIFSVIFILIVVASNYINITTSLALKRSKEISIKKVTGASHLILKIQILMESLFTALLGGILALMLIYLILPLYNEMANQQFDIFDIFKLGNFLYFLMIVLGLGVISGIYPAFFVTKINPVIGLKGLKDPRNKINLFRKGLLVFQFAISACMIFATIGIYSQMKYLNTKNLGFDKDRLVSFNAKGEVKDFIYYNSSSFKEEMKNLSVVQSIAYCSNIPGERLSTEVLEFKNVGKEIPEPSLRFIRVSNDYIKTLELELIDGPGFKDNFPQSSEFILSKEAVKVLQLKNPIYQECSSSFGGNGVIKGIINDYHFASLHDAIEPVVLEYNMNGETLRRSVTKNVIIKLAPGNIKKSLNSIDSKIKELIPGAIINYTFIDDSLDKLYISENKMNKLFKSFTLLTILIACLGLFGISAFNAELKTKEVGIRKIMGASRFSIIKLMSASFLKYIIISIGLSMPVAFWFILNWLQNFAYHTNISIISVLLAVLISVLIAFITVIYHAIKVSRINSVDVLKYE